MSSSINLPLEKRGGEEFRQLEVSLGLSPVAEEEEGVTVWVESGTEEEEGPMVASPFLHLLLSPPTVHRPL